MDILDIARFWSKVAVVGSTECWQWNGSKTKDGYGEFKVGGRIGKSVRVSRLVVEMTTGEPVPDGVIVRHSCDCPGCCNPTHLSTGTHADNVRDRVIRGRTARGEKNGRARITEDQAREIKGSVGKARRIAERYGVSIHTVYAIRYGNAWAHVQPTPAALCRHL